jgi:rRNA processing protein Krr1/Pno1
MSKSARQRANKKARDAATAEAAAAEAAAEAAAAAAAAKATSQPKAKAKGKAKAEPQAPAAEPKAEPKAKGKAKAAPAPAPAEAAPKAEGKAKAKPKKAKKEEEEPAPKKQQEVLAYTEVDDGTGGDWEVSTGQTKKQQKRQDKIDEAKKLEKEEERALKVAAAGGKVATNSVPGMASKESILKDATGKPGAKSAAVVAPVLGVSPAVLAAKEAAAAVAAASAAAATAGSAPLPDDGSVAGTVKVPAEKIGRVIGPKGSNIALIKEKTGVKTVDTAGDMVTIVGQPAEVALATKAVNELIEKGYMSLSFEDFTEEGVNVSPSSIPNIIGERGAIIQVIKKECKVEIDIPPVPKGAPAGKKVKVSVAGGLAGVEQAKEIINSIALYSHHEVTHPGFAHAELEVEEWRYRFLIGKGGSEMRHIQNNYKVRVNIPRENPGVDKVLIVGEESDVARAVKYIEKILYEVNNEPKGRDKPEKAEDTWGDEPPEEAWMSSYMYKRR